MIKITKDKDVYLVEGHSGYSECGSDIVCASVSTLATVTVNNILKYNESALKYEKKDGFLKIEIFKHDHIIDMMLDNMMEMFKDLEKQYKDYIEIN